MRRQREVQMMCILGMLLIIVLGGCHRTKAQTSAGADSADVAPAVDADADGDADTDANSDDDPDSGAGKGAVSYREPEFHRPVAASCENVHSPREPSALNIDNCASHGDCTEGVNGKCIPGIGSAGSQNFCVYDQCQVDADCGNNSVCYCAVDEPARCLSAGNCRVDLDCGKGGYCSPAVGFHCGYYRTYSGYFCHTPGDTCTDDKDCDDDEFCHYNEYQNSWQCETIDNGCMIG